MSAQRPFGLWHVSPSQIWNPEALGRNLGGWLLAALLAGGLYGLWRRERLTRIGLCWAGLIALATYPQLLGLPITGPLKDFTVAIGAYLPAALVIGFATRLSALGLFGMAIVIFMVNPQSWPNEQLPWAAMALGLIAYGPGRLSVGFLIWDSWKNR